jgi:hypothetical protein
MIDQLIKRKINEVKQSDAKYQITQRSLLYNLEPIGIGTPYVESLTSYISRLAMEHNVKVATLMKETIVPYTDKEYLVTNFDNGSYRAKYINGNSLVSIDLVKAIEKATSRKDIIFMTMNLWGGILSKNIIGDYRKWCPECLNTLKLNHQEIYEPLIWYIKDEFNIGKCCIHETSLVEECPHCQKRLPAMKGNLVIGYCQYCSAWLGNRSKDKGINELTEDEKFILLNFQQLLEYAPSSFSFPTKNSFGIICRKIIDDMKFTKLKDFDTFFELGHSQLSTWLKNKHAPSIKSLLKIVKKLDTTIYHLFYNQGSFSNSKQKITNVYEKLSNESIEYILMEEIKLEKPRSLYEIADEIGLHFDTIRRKCPISSNKLEEHYADYRKKLKKSSLKEIEKVLINVLSLKQPLSITEVSNNYGISLTTARRHFPLLVEKIVSRYRNYKERCKKERIKKERQEIIDVILSLKEKGIYPSSYKVSKMLSRETLFMDPELRKLWRNTLYSLGHKHKD